MTGGQPPTTVVTRPLLVAASARDVRVFAAAETPPGPSIPPQAAQPFRDYTSDEDPRSDEYSPVSREDLPSRQSFSGFSGVSSQYTVRRRPNGGFRLIAVRSRPISYIDFDDTTQQESSDFDGAQQRTSAHIDFDGESSQQRTSFAPGSSEETRRLSISGSGVHGALGALGDARASSTDHSYRSYPSASSGTPSPISRENLGSNTSLDGHNVDLSHDHHHGRDSRFSSLSNLSSLSSLSQSSPNTTLFNDSLSFHAPSFSSPLSRTTSPIISSSATLVNESLNEPHVSGHSHQHHSHQEARPAEQHVHHAHHPSPHDSHHHHNHSHQSLDRDGSTQETRQEARPAEQHHSHHHRSLHDSHHDQDVSTQEETHQPYSHQSSLDQDQDATQEPHQETPAKLGERDRRDHGGADGGLAGKWKSQVESDLGNLGSAPRWKSHIHVELGNISSSSAHSNFDSNVPTDDTSFLRPIIHTHTSTDSAQPRDASPADNANALVEGAASTRANGVLPNVSVATHNATHDTVSSAQHSANGVLPPTHNATHDTVSSSQHSVNGVLLPTHNATHDPVATHNATHDTAVSNSQHSVNGVLPNVSVGTHNATSVATHNATHDTAVSSSQHSANGAVATHNATHELPATRNATHDTVAQLPATHNATHDTVAVLSSVQHSADINHSVSESLGVVNGSAHGPGLNDSPSARDSKGTDVAYPKGLSVDHSKGAGPGAKEAGNPKGAESPSVDPKGPSDPKGAESPSVDLKGQKGPSDPKGLGTESPSVDPIDPKAGGPGADSVDLKGPKGPIDPKASGPGADSVDLKGAVNPKNVDPPKDTSIDLKGPKGPSDPKAASGPGADSVDLKRTVNPKNVDPPKDTSVDLNVEAADHGLNDAPINATHDTNSKTALPTAAVNTNSQDKLVFPTVGASLPIRTANAATPSNNPSKPARVCSCEGSGPVKRNARKRDDGQLPTTTTRICSCANRYSISA